MTLSYCIKAANSVRLCLAVIIGLPASTPSESKNSASYALGNFTNGEIGSFIMTFMTLIDFFAVSGWSDGFAFILSFLAPLWTICEVVWYTRSLRKLTFVIAGSFDSSVHISEEASNAAIAVPWAIVYAIGIAGILGWGKLLELRRFFDAVLIDFKQSTLS